MERKEILRDALVISPPIHSPILDDGTPLFWVVSRQEVGVVRHLHTSQPHRNSGAETPAAGLGQHRKKSFEQRVGLLKRGGVGGSHSEP